MKLWNQNTVPHHFKLRRAPSLLRRWRAWEKPQTSTRELDICILRKKWCWEWVRYQLVSEGLLLLLLFVLQESRCSRGEWSHSDKAMTCYTTQNAAWSMSQSILSIVLFLWCFGNEETTSKCSFFAAFSLHQGRGNKFSDGTFECTATAVRAVTRHVWIQLVKLGTLQFPSAKRRQCHGGHNLRSWPCHFIQLPSRNISIKLNNLRSNKCSYGYHGSQQIRIVPHELWSGNSFPIPLF